MVVGVVPRKQLLTFKQSSVVTGHGEPGLRDQINFCVVVQCQLQFAHYHALLPLDKNLAALQRAVINNEARYIKEYPYCGAFQVKAGSVYGRTGTHANSPIYCFSPHSRVVWLLRTTAMRMASQSTRSSFLILDFHKLILELQPG